MHDAWRAQNVKAIFQLSRIAGMQHMVHLSLQSYCVNAMLRFSED